MWYGGVTLTAGRKQRSAHTRAHAHSRTQARARARTHARKRRQQRPYPDGGEEAALRRSPDVAQALEDVLPPARRHVRRRELAKQRLHRVVKLFMYVYVYIILLLYIQYNNHSWARMAAHRGKGDARDHY